MVPQVVWEHQRVGNALRAKIDEIGFGERPVRAQKGQGIAARVCPWRKRVNRSREGEEMGSESLKANHEKPNFGTLR